MNVTPTHPLMAKNGPLTRDELLDLVRYEGLIGLSDDDALAAMHLAAEGLIEITMLSGQPHATSLETPWLASREQGAPDE